MDEATKQLSPAMERRLNAAIEKLYPAGGVGWAPRTGDGSNRRYVTLTGTDSPRIAMILADPDPHRQAEEAGADAAVDELPFLNVARHLAAADVPVPEIAGYDDERGVLVLEDLGETHLADAAAAGGADDERVRDLYRRALDQLVAFQSLPEAPACVLFRRRYDRELWAWELDHFREYGVEARNGIEIGAKDRTRLDAAFSAIADRIAALPAVPVHRDYHSRNLMIDRHGRLRWIDFQDALMGPALYDVASLLYDAYVELPGGLRRDLFRHYADRAAAAGVDLGPDPAADFRLLAVHRMLKAAGRFVYFRDVKGLPGYMAHVPVLLARVRALAADLADGVPELADAVALLAPHVPEWR